MKPRPRMLAAGVLILLIVVFALVAGGASAQDSTASASASFTDQAGDSGGAPDLPFVGVELGTLGRTTTAVAINSHGQVIGSGLTADDVVHAFSWTPASGMIDLGALGISDSDATDINDAGQVVGMDARGVFLWSQAGGMVDLADGGFYDPLINDTGQVVATSFTGGPSGCEHAVLWTQGGGMTDLGTLGGCSSVPQAINSSGEVVGWSQAADGTKQPFAWTPQDGMVGLGSLGGNLGLANAVSDSGQIVGTSRTAAGDMHAFSWTPIGGMVDLGTLGGDSWAGEGSAFSVNNLGQVVGNSFTVDGHQHAFLWTQAAGMTDLGTLGGLETSVLHGDVNSSGEVVGQSTTPDGSRHAFAWTQEDGMVDLGTLGGSQSMAVAVNDNGQIVGNAWASDRQWYPVLWLSVPDAPTAVSAVAGDGQATISFTAPVSDGGAAITSYTVTASPGGKTASGGSSPITVTGLANGTSYTFTVRADNTVGTGPASAASSPVTPIAPSHGQSKAVVGMEQDATCLNVLLSRCDEFWPASIVGVALPGAYRQAPDFSYEPMLVDHVDVATAPVFSLTYHLKQQAVWSDGTSVGADDLIFTWQTIVSPSNDVASRWGYDRITGATKLDAKTVRFDFSSVVGDWQSLFSVVLPQHVLAGRDFNTVWQSEIADPATHAPIGSGPFLVSSWVKGQGMTLTRNPRWWGPHEPSLAEIDFKLVTGTSSEIDALRSGEVQLIYPSPATALSALEGQPGIAMQSSESTGIEHLDFNVATGMTLLRQSWFRQAIAYAIDRQAIATTLYGAFAPNIKPAQNLLYTSQQWQYEPSFADYQPDLVKVTDLMEANGCAKGADGIYVCDGTRASFAVSFISGSDRRQAEFTLIKADLRAAGIEITADVETAEVLYGSKLPTGAFDAVIFLWSLPGDTSYAGAIYGCGGDSNYGRYCSEDVTGLLEAANTEADPAQHAGLVNQAMGIMADDIPSLPLYRAPTLLFSDANLRGVLDNASSQGPFWNAEEWSVTTSGGDGGGSGGRGGGSSGGGGGGGGGGVPDVWVEVGAEQASAPAVAGQIVWHVTVGERVGSQSAFGVFADVTLPAGFAVSNTYSDRGSGCTAATPGLVCNLDWISPANAGHVTIWGTVGQAGPQTLSVHVRHQGPEANPADETASLTLQPATAPFVPPVQPAPGKPVKPVIGRAAIVPRPVAGRRVAVTFGVTRSDNGKPLLHGRMVCDPSIKGKLIRHVEQFKRGVAHLVFTIPKNAKGKLLKVRLTIKAAGGSTTRLATFRVR